MTVALQSAPDIDPTAAVTGEEAKEEEESLYLSYEELKQHLTKFAQDGQQIFLARHLI